MSQTADRLIVIGRGRLIADSTMQEFIQRSSERSVLVRTPDPAKLAELITAAGGVIQPEAAGDGTAGHEITDHGTAPAGTTSDGPARDNAPSDAATSMIVTGIPAPRIGELAASASVVLHELTPRLASLEEAFMELTADSVEYGDHATRPPGPAAGSAAQPAAQPAAEPAAQPAGRTAS
jgi:ABC-2 type transport system ATP-binding protein